MLVSYLTLMERICKISGRSFYLSAADIELCQRLGVPFPTICPAERMRRRYAFRNEFSLYSRKCDLSGRTIFSAFSADAPFPVYGLPEWWGDAWEGTNFGRDFDFSRTFFENFYDLWLEVPRQALSVLFTSMENSDFCNQAGDLKDCYLIVNSDSSERCLYGKGVNRSYDCLDCFKVYDCEACYECCNLNNCKFCTYLFDSFNCSGCHFSAMLIGCQDCFGCVNLRNQRHCFFNEQFKPAEYEARVKDFRSTHTNQEALDRFKEFKSSHFVKWMQEKNTDNCTGDYLVNCKDCYECFDSEELEHCRYCSDLKTGGGSNYASCDVSFYGRGVTECYESVTIGNGTNRIFFSQDIYTGSDQYYCIYCVNGCHDLFGCIGLKKQNYCVLNKRYARNEYSALIERIISHMQETGEWGEFFPQKFSGYAYNETVAQEYSPLTREEALAFGYRWRDKDTGDYKLSTYTIPKAISDVKDSVLGELLACEATGKNYKIQKLELAFYRKFNIPLPRLCPAERHRCRFLSRNRRHLFERSCSECGKQILTTISPERSEPVLCEKDYLVRFI